MTNRLLAAIVTILLATSATAQTAPSFDCAEAAGDVERAICGDPRLAALDRELGALFAYALIGADMDTARQHELIAHQRDWIQGRNGCAQTASLETCVTASYGQRILELKTYYAGATGDGGRISFGPVTYACDAPVFQLFAVFINSPTAWAVVSWEDNAVMLAEAVPGDGTRYGPSVWGEPFAFSMSHDEATLTIPGQGTFVCLQSQG